MGTFVHEADLYESADRLRSNGVCMRGFLNESFLGGHREGGTPDPIPNSEVKPFVADGTARKSAGE